MFAVFPNRVYWWRSLVAILPLGAVSWLIRGEIMVKMSLSRIL